MSIYTKKKFKKHKIYFKFKKIIYLFILLQTDGASASLIMSEKKAKELGLKPKVYLRNFVYKSQDPVDQLLLSPAECIASILKTSGLEMKDIDVWEVHEAFAVSQ